MLLENLEATKLFADTLISLSMVIVVPILVFLTYRSTSVKQSEKRNKKELETALNQAQKDPLGNAIGVNYTHLNQYYEQTKTHAGNGFIITVIVALLGVALIFIGVLFMLFGTVEPAYITCASGVITEFISAIFFYLHQFPRFTQS